MKAFVAKFKDKNFVQKLLIEGVSDLLMVAMGFVIAWYIKTMPF